MVGKVTKKIVFSKHAKQQMNWRGVTENEVEYAIKEPDVKKKLPDEKHKYLNIKVTGVREIKVWYYDFKNIY